jgi:hypothetical protein
MEGLQAGQSAGRATTGGSAWWGDGLDRAQGRFDAQPRGCNGISGVLALEVLARAVGRTGRWRGARRRIGCCPRFAMRTVLPLALLIAVSAFAGCSCDRCAEPQAKPADPTPAHQRAVREADAAHAATPKP